MDSFLERLRWIDLVFVAGMALIIFLTVRLTVRAWKKEKDKSAK